MKKALARLPINCAEHVLKYRPQKRAADWDHVRPFVVQVFSLLPTIEFNTAQSWLTATNELATWTHRRGIPLTIENVFDAEHVKAFQSYHLARPRELGWETTTLSTHTSHLRRIGALINPASDWGTRAGRAGNGVTKTTLRAPYTDAELAQLVKAISTLPDGRKATAARRLLTIGLGAGLTTPEFRAVTGAAVLVDGGITWIRVPGNRQRLVPVAPPWDAMLREAAVEVGSATLFPIARAGKNGFSEAIDAVQPKGCAKLNVSRLRTTWMVHRLRAGVDGRELLLNYAGLKTLNSLQDLIRFLPQPDVSSTLHAMTQPSEGINA